jgi:hypothetical protein
MNMLLGDFNTKVGKEDSMQTNNWEREFTRN